MKRIIFPLFLFSFVLSAIGQKKEKEVFYMLDGDFKGTTEKAAIYFIHAKKINDSCWQFDTYHKAGPMISSEQYSDDKGKERNGYSCFFNALGEQDSCGNYSHSLKDGTWIYYNAGDLVKKEFYLGEIKSVKNIKKPVAIKPINYDGDSSSMAASDSLKKANSSSEYITRLTDSMHVEAESYFPDGASGWTRYMIKNFNYPAIDIKNKIQGKVIVQFIVDADGKIYEPKISKSVEYFLDEECLRLIIKSPPWVPATKDGIKVKSYKKQPLTFKLPN